MQSPKEQPKDSGKKKSESRQNDVAFDRVEEGSQESFPASDPPSWTISTGEKGSDAEGSPEPNAETQGCAPSFLMQERGEIGGMCPEEPDPQEEYVQPDKEKEAGGEG
jgi:hypothetical protein